MNKEVEGMSAGAPDLRSFIPPAQVIEVIAALRELGNTAYIAGGAVRDMVMGRPRPEDWDVATSASPEQVMAAFDRVIPSGVAHGTVTVLDNGMSIEVTTYRVDGPYLDGRHPEYVRFVPRIEDDLARRDFTMNAMAYDPIAGELIDPYGGREAIRARVITCVGEPRDRFSEDKLRMVRAARFAAKLRFRADPRLVEAARELAPQIRQVSVERVYDELAKMMGTRAPSLGFELLEEMGITPYVLPELCADVPRERRARLYAMCDELPPDLVERFAVLLAPLGESRARQTLSRMRASNRTGADVVAIVRGAQAVLNSHSAADANADSDPAGLAGLSSYSLRLEASRIGVGNLAPAVRVACIFAGCSADERRALDELVRSVVQQKPALRIRDLAVDGHDVMNATGIGPGPGVRLVLSALLDEVLRDPALNTRERLLKLARNRYQSLHSVPRSGGVFMVKQPKVVVAPDSFKGSLTARQVCEAAEEGLRRVWPEAEIVSVPMADGGEGTVQSLVDATSGRIVNIDVTGPLGEPVAAFFGVLGDGVTAVIEMAAASGLPLVPQGLRNPLSATTRGTGELIESALDMGCRKFIIGIGGSATNDGGAGMAQALGVRLLDEHGVEIGPGGAELARLTRIDASGLDPRASQSEFVVACDVDNPLTGPRGASAVYGPQKGATPEMVKILDDALKNLAAVVRRDLGVDVDGIPGAGAAGGLGAGLMAFLGASLKRGIDIVVETVRLREQMKGAALVITGEGRTDFQTLFGKTPMGVANVAKSLGIPVVVISGSVADDAGGLYAHGIDALMSIAKGPCTIEEAIAGAGPLMADAAETAARLIAVGLGASVGPGASLRREAGPGRETREGSGFLGGLE
jgi:glycerate kinase